MSFQLSDYGNNFFSFFFASYINFLIFLKRHLQYILKYKGGTTLVINNFTREDNLQERLLCHHDKD